MATRLLQDLTVEAGVFELSRGGLIRSGGLGLGGQLLGPVHGAHAAP